MPNVEDAYSSTEDLLKGDLPLPGRHGDGSQAIKNAAEDIDIQLGHKYVTPIVIPDEPKFRTSRLLLKKINNYIASGRLLLDMTALGEDAELHAYGKSLLDEGKALLAQLASGAALLPGAPLNEDQDASPTKAMIDTPDSYSLVEAFTRTTMRGEMLPPGGIMPYSNNPMRTY